MADAIESVRDPPMRSSYAVPTGTIGSGLSATSFNVHGKRSTGCVNLPTGTTFRGDGLFYAVHLSSMLVRMMDDMDALRTTLLGRLDAIDARVAKIETAFYYSPDGEGAQQAVAEACALAVVPDNEATRQAVAQLAATAANQSPRKRKCEQLDAP